MTNPGQTDIVMGNIVPLQEKIKELNAKVVKLEQEIDNAFSRGYDEGWDNGYYSSRG